MNRLNNFSNVRVESIFDAIGVYQTPFYLYDEQLIIDRCKQALNMPNAYGITVRYAMKANSTKAIMQIIQGQGLHFDASSLNEAKRAVSAGIPHDSILLTTQEVPAGDRRAELEQMMLAGMQYNVCSLRQLFLAGDFVQAHGIPLSIRVHPGVGAGETASRNTGDDYSCFGVHLSDIDEVLEYANKKNIVFNRVHTHIGSGGDPEMWQNNIDIELDIINEYFPDAKIINLGGGLKEARMPDETAANIEQLGLYAKRQLELFYARTGRKLKMEVEPGTYIMANAGYIVTSVVDKKITGENGFNFVILDGGMDVNARPAMYGSRHPFYVLGENGELKYSDYFPDIASRNKYEAVIVGCCCESGDCQTLNGAGEIVPREIAQPEISDYIVIGGAGAYCSSMTPFNYNSHEQAAEVLLTEGKEIKLVRRRQSLEQMEQSDLDYTK